MIYPAAAINIEESMSRKKLSGVRLAFMPASANNGTSTQYINSNCVMAINKRFGHLTKRKKAMINFT